MRYFDISVYEDPVEEVLWGGEDFIEVTDEEITGQSRWTTYYSQVLQYKDGTFWQAEWSRGSTEYQDTGIDDFELFQVEPQEVTVTQYKVIE